MTDSDVPTWKAENIEEALKCWNLKHIIAAALMGEPQPKHLSMRDLVGEGAEHITSTNVQDAVEVVDVDV